VLRDSFGCAEPLQISSGIAQEWFGLFLLPVVSWAADGLLTLIWFIGRIFRYKQAPINSVASGLAIDLSIQFLLFWMPFLVLIAWWTHRPLTLLFDMFEVRTNSERLGDAETAADTKGHGRSWFWWRRASSSTL